jgi:lipopolysaccharide/colanic/teichoic acid biosynthesis glycosyltransferase
MTLHLTAGPADRMSRKVLNHPDRGQGLLESLANRAVALLLLVLLAPIMALIAVLIWRMDGSPVSYSHYRVGLGGRVFRCLKFRSMRKDSDAVLRALLAVDARARSEWERDRKLSRDPRITPVGRFLRRTSLDELPQLLNVLAGDMNLVGPRPITLAELPRYGQARWHYLSVLPGMTGLWQVSGRNRLSYEDRVSLDRRYVDTRSWHMDLQILVRTVKVVVGREGAY